MTVSPNPTEGNSQDLERILAVLRRRVVLIVGCTLLTAVAAYGFSKQQTKEYTATASLVFNSGQLSQQVAGLQPVNGNETAAQQSTWVKLLELEPTAMQTAKEINRKNRQKQKKGKQKGKQTGNGAQSPGSVTQITAEQIKSSVSVAPQGESNVVDVSATWTSPKMAARVANTYAKRFVAAQVNASQSYFAQARRLVEKQYSALSDEEKEEPQGPALLDRIQSLTILAKLKTGEAQVAQAASVPGAPSSPKVTRNTILGALLGLLLGLGLAFLFERLNRRLREPEEAQEAFGLPALATVPESKAIMASNKGESAAELPFMENEAFRMLRASLRYFNVDEEMRTVLVTSENAGVGKSTVAWNLGRVAAAGSRAMVVEADLRNPSLAEQHGLEPMPGLAEVLTGQIGLDAAIQFKPVTTNANGGAAEEPSLHVIVAGALPPNPAELLESKAMGELLTQLSERYELVVIDTAPIGVVSDCFPLLRRAEGVIGVARMGISTRDSVGRMREQLDRLDAPALGIVANGLRLGRRGKHRYGYGYYGPPAEQRPPATPPAAQQSIVPPPHSGSSGAPEQA
jgi:receptor protein-tyrosine kinase